MSVLIIYRKTQNVFRYNLYGTTSEIWPQKKMESPKSIHNYVSNCVTSTQNKIGRVITKQTSYSQIDDLRLFWSWLKINNSRAGAVDNAVSYIVATHRTVTLFIHFYRLWNKLFFYLITAFYSKIMSSPNIFETYFYYCRDTLALEYHKQVHLL